MGILEYCIAIGVDLKIVFSHKENIFLVHFFNCKIKGDCGPYPMIGWGADYTSAIENYLKKVRGKTLIYSTNADHNGDPNQKEFTVPKHIESTFNYYGRL
jgi:hypothetical protein